MVCPPEGTGKQIFFHSKMCQLSVYPVVVIKKKSRGCALKLSTLHIYQTLALGDEFFWNF